MCLPDVGPSGHLESNGVLEGILHYCGWICVMYCIAEMVPLGHLKSKRFPKDILTLTEYKYLVPLGTLNP